MKINTKQELTSLKLDTLAQEKNRNLFPFERRFLRIAKSIEQEQDEIFEHLKPVFEDINTNLDMIAQSRIIEGYSDKVVDEIKDNLRKIKQVI